MKYLLTILFFLTAYFVNAQYIPNVGAYQYKGLKQTNSLQPPTGTAFPVTLTNAPDSNYAAWYYNKADTSFYQFNPVPKTWTKLQSNGGLQIDSVFITSIDSLFITNSDSIFIITNNNDTLFIGTGNPAVDTIYQRGDSIFAVKSGIEFLAAVTGSGTPTGGMDTAYSRQDSIFGVKNNGEFLIATSQQTIDSIFISNTDSIFIISGNDTIFIGTDSSNKSRFGIEDNTGIQDRSIDMQAKNLHIYNLNNLDMVSGDSTFTDQGFEIYGNPTNGGMYNQDDGHINESSVDLNPAQASITSQKADLTLSSNFFLKPDSIYFTRNYDGSTHSQTFSKPTTGDYYIPLTVNGHAADAQGNIIDTTGGGGIIIDSVFIHSIDSIFITTTDSIFIVSGNDTIFIGISNSGKPLLFNNIAQMASRTASDSTYALVAGYYNKNDGGGGLFMYDSLSTDADVTGMIIGKWRRLYNGDLNLKWFGAKGIGIAGYKADSAALHQSFAYIKARGYGNLYVPGSDSPYCWAGLGLVSPNNFNFYGAGKDKTRFLFINMNFPDHYYNGTFVFFGTFATTPQINMSRTPRYQMFNGLKGDTWVRLRNISDASHFAIGDVIKPSGHAYNKSSVTGKTIWRDNAFAMVTRISGDSLILDHGLSMDIRADNSAYALHEVSIGLTSPADTGSAVVFRPNAGTTSNFHLGVDQEGYNISVHDMSVDVSAYDYVLNQPYDTSQGSPGSTFTLGSCYGCNLYNLRLNSFGNLDGQYLSNFIWQNIDVQSSRKVFDFGNESSEGLVEDIRYKYKNEFHDTTNVALIFINNNSHHIQIRDLDVTGAYVGNHVIQVQGGIHDFAFSNINMNIPQFTDVASDVIHITTEDTVQGSYPENMTFETFNIVVGTPRRFISFVGLTHHNFNYTGDVIFRDLTFRGHAVNNTPLLFDNADSIYAVNILTPTQDSVRIRNTTYLRNLFAAVGSNSSSTIFLDSVIVDCAVTPTACFDGLHPVVSVPIDAANVKNIDISPESGNATGYSFAWRPTEAILTYQFAIKGTYKFYITYYK